MFRNLRKILTTLLALQMLSISMPLNAIIVWVSPSAELCDLGNGCTCLKDACQCDHARPEVKEAEAPCCSNDPLVSHCPSPKATRCCDSGGSESAGLLWAESCTCQSASTVAFTTDKTQLLYFEESDAAPGFKYSHKCPIQNAAHVIDNFAKDIFRPPIA
jgi:hypothetical protein